ncbi:MAG: PIN domain-containing protein [Acidobacteria bacterium]|nr:PIN domain-containing protein [Acidobacteriota bacterium]MBI3425949.1 PIN domain-containing protein [Acidobacteriota bacterium]
MTQVLFDTNVLLDALLKRAPWDAEAAGCWQACDEGRIMGCLTASTLTDIFYIARKHKGLTSAFDAIRVCLDTFAICQVDRRALEQALDLPGVDFEDNLQIACATLADLDAIVTRDKDGFRNSIIPAFTPAELITQLNTNQE